MGTCVDVHFTSPKEHQTVVNLAVKWSWASTNKLQNTDHLIQTFSSPVNYRYSECLFYVSTVNNSVGVFVGKKYFNSKVFAGLLNLKGEGFSYSLGSVCTSDKTLELLAYFIFEEKYPTLWRVELYKMYRRYKMRYARGTNRNHLEKKGFSEENYRWKSRLFVLLQVSSLSSRGNQESAWPTAESQNGWSVAFPERSLPFSDTPVPPLIPCKMSLLC